MEKIFKFHLLLALFCIKYYKFSSDSYGLTRVFHRYFRILETIEIADELAKNNLISKLDKGVVTEYSITPLGENFLEEYVNQLLVWMRMKFEDRKDFVDMLISGYQLENSKDE